MYSAINIIGQKYICGYSTQYKKSHPDQATEDEEQVMDFEISSRASSSSPLESAGVITRTRDHFTDDGKQVVNFGLSSRASSSSLELAGVITGANDDGEQVMNSRVSSYASSSPLQSAGVIARTKDQATEDKEQDFGDSTYVPSPLEPAGIMIRTNRLQSFLLSEFIPTIMRLPSLCHLERICFLGGESFLWKKSISTFQILHSTTYDLFTGPRMLQARAYFAAATTAYRIFVFGGKDKDRLASCEVYEGDRKRFATISTSIADFPSTVSLRKKTD
ncbi:hypothetical protein Aperf_G00000094683 [Anoplocephala perfoliata]